MVLLPRVSLATPADFSCENFKSRREGSAEHNTDGNRWGYTTAAKPLPCVVLPRDAARR